ncbi:MAG TPA: NAD(+)/NADH kinase [Acidimicrobiales bacterium]|nr:NAD(+)/NADH kinase [Acidimicrobiales bacterium]
MNVLLVLHPKRVEATTLAESARAWWERRGHHVEVWDDSFPTEGPVDLAISLGGDGTMLRTVQLALRTRAPVLGINLGRMGYLTEVEPSAMEQALERLLAGDYAVEERMVLDVEIDSGAPPPDQSAASDEHETAPAAASPGLAPRPQPVRLLALNEVIVEKTAPGHTIHVAVAIGGRPFLTYVADGLLACTPTGSTAYNLSARGPVVSPQLRAIVLTPVAPHLVFDRSLVLEPDERVEMTLLDGHEAAAVIDGSILVPLPAGARVACRGAEETARLVTFGDVDFHSVLRARFSLTDR